MISLTFDIFVECPSCPCTCFDVFWWKMWWRFELLCLSGCGSAVMWQHCGSLRTWRIVGWLLYFIITLTCLKVIYCISHLTCTAWLCVDTFALLFRSVCTKVCSAKRFESRMTTRSCVGSININAGLKIGPELPPALLEHPPFNLHEEWCHHKQACWSAML